MGGEQSVWGKGWRSGTQKINARHGRCWCAEDSQEGRGSYAEERERERREERVREDKRVPTCLPMYE